ncbi:phosphoenolpyruvate carboxykinase [Culicoidibacter larvae]|uniref:Phosphoenolpyruvate carboxykinase n=1 Tax=Culicoidibacter larvae TaxID=2579976 RepID=A0A5R8Q928_9FIRM|nr:phosphoenolpyruvate carboxykinase [Culicoidibacter larvae]TLG72135.1 phosphoenolpyruvate carboxykinase [Culicoidibacter larvae]
MSMVFELSRGSAVLNFTAQYCQTQTEILESTGFKKVLQAYVLRLERKQKPIYLEFSKDNTIDAETIQNHAIQIFKLLLVMNYEEILSNENELSHYLQKRELFLEFSEDLYGYWRRLERYAIAYNNESQNGIQNSQFIETHDRFENLVLSTYRRITETIRGSKNRVYRQLIAGVNAGLIVNREQLAFEREQYPMLRKVPLIESVILHPPFITYPKRNTRDGIFKEVFENPIANLELDPQEWFCYPAKVGNLLALVYFHKDFMSQGVTLCNLFELAELEEAQTRKPDMIYIFGAKEPTGGEERTVFYHDKANAVYIGYASYSENIDYFGYMKKMILTLHNVSMIDLGGLPLHGAMAHIILHDGTEKNVIIIGDSGAGKSETLEALRTIGDEYIKDLKIVFDDMGVMVKNDGQLRAHGTEIGAFVRLDDLDSGYAYKEIDRSVFMNPDKINARIVIPVATYEEITYEYPIDLLLYANNYDDGEILDFFTESTTALDTFRRGARFAKGTTTETGLVESYFANPFGPVQRMEQTDALLDQYFRQLFAEGILVGQIRTKLGIAGSEQSGPRDAAIALLEYLQTK